MPSWSTQQLAEFVVTVSTAADEATAAERGVERAAEVLDAEVAALVREGRIVTCVGWPRFDVPEAELVELAASGAGAVVVPGAGERPAVVVQLEDDRGGALILARASEPLDVSEQSLLQGMARTLALNLQLLGAVAGERALRMRTEQQSRENERLLGRLQERQRLMEGLAAIQRSISHRAPLADTLEAIVATGSELLSDGGALLVLRDPEEPEWLKTVAQRGMAEPVVRRASHCRMGEGAAGRAALEGRLVLVEEYAEWQSAIPHAVSAGYTAVMAAPVHELGEVVGALLVGSQEPGRTYSRAEQEVLLTLAEHASLALTDARTVGTMLHQALHDALTGLPNRALFLDRLHHALARRGKAGRVGVLFCDLDRFKAVNDSLGHAAGDELLVAVAERIGRCLREADTAARLGGDEFAVLIEDVGSEREAVSVANRMIEALKTPFELQGREVFVSSSIGIAYGTGVLTGGEELLRNADVAMYRAKAEGKGRFAIFEPSMRAEVIERLELEADLQRAVGRGELVVHYQPLVTLADGTLAGFEALVRWNHPTRGLLGPGVFVPLAEESDLIIALGGWVLDEACRQATRWGRRMTVNLSGRQLAQPDLVDVVAGALERSGLEPRRLVLEITETVLMHDSDATIERLRALRELGVQLAVDDFGTGYSSLQYLRRFPIDLLKMAKPFVDGVSTSREGAALAKTIIDLGNSLGLEIVAEGIEGTAELAQLRRLGCHLGQGYLFSPPLPSEEVETALADGAWATHDDDGLPAAA